MQEGTGRFALIEQGAIARRDVVRYTVQPPA